jgi:hypothetical protein
MPNHEKRSKLVYRSPEIVRVGDAVLLTEGSKERTWDTGSTGWSEDNPSARQGSGTRKKRNSKERPTVK